MSAPAGEAPLLLPERLRDALRSWSRAADPEEACGLLLGARSGGADRVRAVTRGANVHAGDRRHAFELDPGHLVRAHARARREGWRVLGTWHAHPAGPAALSAADRRGAWEEAVLLVVGAGGALGAWRLAADRVAALRVAGARPRAAQRSMSRLPSPPPETAPSALMPSTSFA